MNECKVYKEKRSNFSGWSLEHVMQLKSLNLHKNQIIMCDDERKIFIKRLIITITHHTRQSNHIHQVSNLITI